MKYFTIDRWIGMQRGTGGTMNAPDWPVEEYRQYLQSIKTILPIGLQQLTDEFSLHDGRLREIRIDIATARASLRFEATDATGRTRKNISLHYTGVAVVESTGDPMKGLPGPHAYGDLGYHELESLPLRVFEHRLLFSSGIELVVRFSGADLEEHGID